MPDPVMTRFVGLPGWAVLWAMALVCFGLFGMRAARYIGVLRRARPEVRWDRIPERVRLAGRAKVSIPLPAANCSSLIMGPC